MYDWAKFRKTKGAIKLHCLMDIKGSIPTFMVLTDGKKHDATIAQDVPFPLLPDSIITFDRAYMDFGVFGAYQKNGIFLVEDIAQAHGARWKEKPMGSFGHVSAISFHPSKNLGAFGDGGAVLTNDDAIAKKVRIFRNLGKSDKYRFDAIAPNSKLDTLQAVILGIKLRYLDTWVQRRSNLAQQYLDGLRDITEIKLPRIHPQAQHAWHLFVIRTEKRMALQSYLKSKNIRAGLHYPIAAHQQPAIAEQIGHQSLPLAEEWAKTCLTLPLSHEHRDDEIATVIHEVRQFFGVQ